MSVLVKGQMTESGTNHLCLIAGKGVYPLLLAESARRQGVNKLDVIAFRKETDPSIADLADNTHWIHVGDLGGMLNALEKTGAVKAVMAGQITPSNLFRMRMDRKMLSLLKRLNIRNAETIFGAVAEEMKRAGVELIPASTFMESHMPAAGTLTEHEPSAEIRLDMEFGMKIARAMSNLDIGQTVVVKQGTVLAVEAFEGTNDAIRRAGSLGGAGIVAAKAAKSGHDMRFDIPVVGPDTIKLLKKTRARGLAIEEGRSILLERDRVIREADRAGICVVAVERGDV